MRTTLRGLFAVVLAVLAGCGLFGRRAHYEALRAEKLGKAVFSALPWSWDFDAVRARARADGKLVFGYFTRSYAG